MIPGNTPLPWRSSELKNLGYGYECTRRFLKGRRDETDFRYTQSLLAELQRWKDRSEAEFYYFDKPGFTPSSALPYAWSPIGHPLEMLACSP